jgi:NAD(P)-dependent dehydrogenase (short-subunit alcohol dehydrogenase family)
MKAVRSAELAGTVVIVFGAGSSGAGLSIGEATAHAYAAAGASVACVDRDRGAAERVAKAIVGDGGTAIDVHADVTSETDVVRAVAQVVDGLGPPGVLHNNVGVAVRGTVIDLTRDEWDAAIAVNLTGCYLTVRHVLPHLLARGKGAIVNVSSLASIRATGYTYPAYSAAKAAVNQLTVSLALTYASHGIRANAILPGLIDTPLVAAQLVDDPAELDRELAARHARSPTGRMGTPWEVADVAVFLASDRASYVNGVCLPVDGGLAARVG